MSILSVIKMGVFVGVGTAILIAPFSWIKPVVVADIAPQIPDQKIAVAQPVPIKMVEKKRHEVVLPDFASIRDVKQKKQSFFDFIRPAILSENQKITQHRAQLTLIRKSQLSDPILTTSQLDFINTLARQYKVNDKLSSADQITELLSRVDIIPPDLVMVQAANESAWGTSRFARIGLNFFGIWCYREGCGMVPNGREAAARHEVQMFKSVDAAVRRYLYNINTNAAYEVLRTIRGQLRQQNYPLKGEVLACGLLAYSQRGVDYVVELGQMIRHNKAYMMPPQHNRQSLASSSNTDNASTAE
jgi:Bax protein